MPRRVAPSRKHYMQAIRLRARVAGLERMRERYRSLFQQSPVALIEEDSSGVKAVIDEIRPLCGGDLRRYVLERPELLMRAFAAVRPLDANAAALRLFGARSRRALLRDLSAVATEETLDHIREVFLSLAAGKLSFEGETVVKTLDGQRRNVLVGFSVLAGFESDFTRCIVSFSDLTALRAAEAEILRQRHSLLMQRTETLAATGRLAAGVAHEINNPLQGIVAQLRLLTEDLPPHMADNRRIAVIQEGVRRIAKIVAHLLKLHRPGHGGKDTALVNDVLTHLVELVSSSFLGKGVTIETRVEPVDLEAPLSPDELSQVLLNLLLNAADAMPKGGVIRVEARREDSGLRLAVSDSGHGIRPEDRLKLFMPFFTTKGPRGTGLGLTVAHSIVTASGGDIDFSDRPGGGAIFTLRWPAQPQP
jgi:signal transduction histidine kinase